MYSLASLLMLIEIVVTSTSTQDIHYVKPDNSSPVDCSPSSQPCLTLNDYNDPWESHRYFTSRSTFVFLAGNHSLSFPIHLRNISHLTLRGKKNASNINIMCMELNIAQSQSVNIEGLTFLLCSDHWSGASALNVSSSKKVVISNLKFKGNDEHKFTAQAMHSDNSAITITNCLFRESIGSNGGAITALNGTSLILTANLFTGNYLQPTMVVLFMH